MTEKLAEPVRYFSQKYRNYTLVMVPTTEQLVTDSVTGRQTRFVEPARYIQFDNYEYLTDDPEEVAFLDNHPSLTGKTKHGKVAKICIEKSAPPDKVQTEFLELVQEFGRENVINMLKKRKDDNVEPETEEEGDSAFEAAKAALLKAKKRLQKAKKTGDDDSLRKAKKAMKKAEKALEALGFVAPKKMTKGG